MKKLFGVFLLLAVCVAAVGYFGFCRGEATVFEGYEVASTSSPFSVKVLDEEEGNVETKLFGLIGVNTEKAKKSEDREVLLGGFPLGLELDLKGLIVTGKAGVVTADGAVSPCENTDIRPGDVLIAIDGKSVGDDKAITEILNNKEGLPVELCLLRGSETKNIPYFPQKTF